MKTVSRSIVKALGALVFVFAFGLAVPPAPCLASSAAPPVRLPGHVPARAIASSHFLGSLSATTGILMAFSLPLRNQPELEELLKRLYDPADTLYGHYLTPEEFTDRFCPTQDDYDVVAAYARNLGFRVTGTHPNRTLLDVSGSAAAVEAAFSFHLDNHQARDGRVFYAPDDDPTVPDFIAFRIAGVIGLDNAAVWHGHSRLVSAGETTLLSPLQIGTGPGSALAPSDIRTAYSLNGVAANGSGQTLGLFELDGYNPADVSTYVSYFGLTPVPLQNVLIDGFSGRAGSGAGEVTLDIELQIALAPGASKIIVYEGPNSNTGVVHTYNRIATDNLAKQISTSWGLSEGQSSAAVMNSENTAFQQMAAQGQSIYAASGDSGAYDNGSTLSVDDPASQPYMVGVGGTQLFVSSPGGPYSGETTWNVNNTVSGGAGGGGVSSRWTIPSWQKGVTTSASATMRNVPDVSLNADQYTGYSIYYKGGWRTYGGTSCAAPLWAAFTARVNQQRVASGMTTLGFANPSIYQIATSAQYATDFHDIADGSTNLSYRAVSGYDNATGWGSFNGANLFADLATPPAPVPPPVPTGLTATAGDGAVTLSWGASSGATSYNVYRSTISGGEGSTPIKSGITATTYTDPTATNGTTYYYEISATNSAGTSGPSNEVWAAPVASNLAIVAGPNATVSKTSAQIQWTTNVAATSVARYGTSAGKLTKTVSTSALVANHSLTLPSLRRLRTYYYWVSSTASGATVSSAVSSFTTR
jgi:kumamolisin